tara:strand:+ start:39702 stop:40409 length:708 start_codon:yes stop_codon:yes gene_type:complete
MKNLPLVILAGGLGTRLSELTKKIPKPLIKIGNKPIIHHIIDHYAYYGVREFIICVGYKKKKFLNYFKNNKNNKKLTIKIVDTGLKSFTGDRLKKIKSYIKGDFFLTYGDGLSSINIKKQYKLFKKKNKIGLISCVKPRPRFGIVKIKNDNVISFIEKPIENRWINGGFFIFKNTFFKYLSGKKIILEKSPLENLVIDRHLVAYKHDGFWKCMDTANDKKEFEKIIKLKKKEWKK